MEQTKGEDASVSEANSEKAKEQKVEAEIAALLVNKWKDVESHYLSGIRKAFQVLFLFFFLFDNIHPS